MAGDGELELCAKMPPDLTPVAHFATAELKQAGGAAVLLSGAVPGVSAMRLLQRLG